MVVCVSVWIVHAYCAVANHNGIDYPQSARHIDNENEVYALCVVACVSCVRNAVRTPVWVSFRIW